MELLSSQEKPDRQSPGASLKTTGSHRKLSGKKERLLDLEIVFLEIVLQLKNYVLPLNNSGTMKIKIT